MEHQQAAVHPQSPKLLEQVRTLLRTKHYSLRTEETYLQWIKRFIFFHNKRHPREMGAEEIGAFLSHLATTLHVSASTQNQALNALVFLYRHILQKDFALENVVRAKRPKRLPVVLTRGEIIKLLAHAEGTKRLLLELLYGTGMRLMEVLRLRIKDVDFDRNQIMVREGKGDKDRLTMLPQKLKEELRNHIERVRVLHEKDLQGGYGAVFPPDAIAQKYPQAAVDWKWQYAFPSKHLSADPRTGEIRRHHLHENVLQKTVKESAHRAGLTKMVGVHTLRHSFAYVVSLVMWCLCRCSCRVFAFVVKEMSFISVSRAPEKFVLAASVS